MCEDRTNNSDTGIATLLVLFVLLAIVVCVAYFAFSSAMAATVPPTLPDPKLTPGALAPGVVSSLTKDQLCAKGFTTKSVRNVSEETKAFVYKAYGMKDHVGACHCPVTNKAGKVVDQGCEIDHLCSLEISCTNGRELSTDNLWPEPYCGPHNAHEKDKLENKLHELVCAGKIEPHRASISYNQGTSLPARLEATYTTRAS
jgi:hypothetical protein